MNPQNNKLIITLYFVCVISSIIIACSIAKLILDKYYRPEDKYEYFHIREK